MILFAAVSGTKCMVVPDFSSRYGHRWFLYVDVIIKIDTSAGTLMYVKNRYSALQLGAFQQSLRDWLIMMDYTLVIPQVLNDLIFSGEIDVLRLLREGLEVDVAKLDPTTVPKFIISLYQEHCIL